jgi:site-specific recombinase XerD
MFPTLNGLPAQRKPKKLLDQVRDVMRLRHYSIRTERCYCEWIVRFIRFHGKRHPRETAEAEVTAFLTHLAREGNVVASTQNQALSALLFDSFAPPAQSASRPARLTRGYPRRSALYKEVLKEEIGWLEGVEQTTKPKRLPLVLPRDEVHRVFAHLHGMPRFMTGLLYGSGLRLMARKGFAHVPGSARNGDVLCLCAEIRDRFWSIYWLFL